MPEQVGSYRLLHRLGEGGMGTVWFGEHTLLGRRAAVKLLHSTYSARPDIVTRFFNEARAATAISDPGIVQVFDFGYAADGRAYLIMELLEGETLDRRLQRLQRLPVHDALRIMRQVASSLGAAHARGIVHRDLKPENIFLVGDPEVIGGERAKILDFGIAKLGSQSGGAFTTAVDAIMGTPTYMSPEQCRGTSEVSARSDIYALGCVLYQLVTGRPPFVSDGSGTLLVLHLQEVPALASSHVPNVPSSVDALIAKCLAKDPAERYASGCELANAIGVAVSGSSYNTLDCVAAQTTASPSTATFRRISTIVGTLLLACAAIVAAWILQGTSPPSGDELARHESTHAEQTTDLQTLAQPAALLDAAPAALVSIEIRSQPAGAHILVGDNPSPRGSTPWTLTIEQTSSPVELQLVYGGYATQRKTINPATDREVFVVLDKLAPRRPAHRPRMPKSKRPPKSKTTEPSHDPDGPMNPFPDQKGPP